MFFEISDLSPHCASEVKTNLSFHSSVVLGECGSIHACCAHHLGQQRMAWRLTLTIQAWGHRAGQAGATCIPCSQHWASLASLARVDAHTCGDIGGLLASLGLNNLGKRRQLTYLAL